MLPDEAWSRRVRGSFASDLANRFPDLAHAVLTPNAQHGYTVSVRTPLVKASGADALCRKLPASAPRDSVTTVRGRSCPVSSIPAPARQVRHFVAGLLTSRRVPRFDVDGRQTRAEPQGHTETQGALRCCERP